MKIQRESYQRARNAEELADLCWQLADMLQERFIGYEADCSRLRSIAIDFEREFNSLVGSYDA